MARRPAVAGMFYEADEKSLRESIERCFLGMLGPGRLPASTRKDERKIIGLVCPHAGYIYSGAAAAHSYLALAEEGLPEIAVILGPNHHGLGEPVAVATDSTWITPLGNARVDTETADAILEHSHYAREDNLAHVREHSLEVQVPLLQYLGGDSIRIVPIALAHMGPTSTRAVVSDLGSSIAKALANKNAVVIASTDLTHYESKAAAQTKDALVLERIVNLDPEGLLRVVEQNSISMCGVVGTAVTIEACKNLGASSARKLAYYTSGDVTGDTKQVVGYAAVAVTP
ncbi:MAG: AmmeMemoRadiSam system protein B [Armatimonadetes bacterium]|nr:AmmeMemoRadiSam system protein B [Armatimonadota bacterium]